MMLCKQSITFKKIRAFTCWKDFRNSCMEWALVQLTEEYCFVNFSLGLSSIWQAAAWDRMVAAKGTPPTLHSEESWCWNGPWAPRNSVTIVSPCLSSNSAFTAEAGASCHIGYHTGVMDLVSLASRELQCELPRCLPGFCSLKQRIGHRFPWCFRRGQPPHHQL